MGIRGLSTFVRNQQLLEDHNLHDTPLVIDGLNLVNTLYFKFQRDNRNDHMFGGDYTLWSVYVRNFFNSLKTCGVIPIVVLDGSFDPSLEKLKTKLKRFKSNLSTAFKIFKNNCLNEGINPLLNSYVFRQVMKIQGIYNYQSIYEADDIIPQIAKDLNCPILSNDSDFLIDSIPGGVIPIDFLLDNFRVFTFEQNNISYKYLKCSIFRLQNMKQKFPRINLDLIQLCSAILGNDYIDVNVANCILSRIPKFSCVGSNRQKQINSVLQWISRYDSYEDILEDLKKYLQDSNHTLIRYIESHFIFNDNQERSKVNSIDDYFVQNLEKLFFFKKLDIPLWVHQRFVENKIHNRILCIREAHIEWFSPLVEDFSFPESSYECIYELCQYIYGLLRTSNESVANIKRYSRRDTNLVVDKVPPHLYIDDHLLPMLKDLESLTGQDRFALFYRILAIEPSLVGQLRAVISENLTEAYSVDQTLLNQFVVMILVMIYFCRHFSSDLWIEFVFALFINIMLVGHFCAEDVPVFLKIDPIQRQLLNCNLYSFNKVPSFTNVKVFMPRVVHFYNSFQNCLVNIAFLAQVLDLSSLFNADRYICGLKGTFLYNLTCDLCSRPKPLLHLEELLGRQKFVPLKLFRNLLDFVFQNGNRKLLIYGQCDKDVIPCSLLADKVSARETSPDDRFLVRAFESTNRKTHINSQKLKLRNRSRK